MSNSLDKGAKIFVAGHTGLIGSAVVRRLRAGGFENLLLASRSELDLTVQSSVADFFSRECPEYVILAAGKVGGIVENRSYPADFISTNLAIQANVIGSAHASGVSRLIFFGSSCMYPRECQQPMGEDALFTGRPEPTSLAYAVAKMAGLQSCIALNQQHGGSRFLPLVPNSAYGPNDNFDPDSGHVLSALIRRFHEAKVGGADSVTLWGSGSPRREFVHADDVADACIMLLGADLAGVSLPLNLGCGVDVSIKELAEEVRAVVGFEGSLEWDASKPDGAPRKLLDSSRLLALGWRPRVGLREGLESTYSWYLDKLNKRA